MMDLEGLAQYREQSIAFLNFVRESTQTAIASLEEWRGDSAAMGKLLPRQRINDYWHQEWPSGRYPTVEEWGRMRDEIAAGGVVLAQVGANKPTDWVQLVELGAEADPRSAVCIVWLRAGDVELRIKPSGDARLALCPTYGPNPKNAIWRVRILSTQVGA